MNDICAVLFSTHICAGIGKMKLALLNKKRSDNISGGLGIQEIRNTILECKILFNTFMLVLLAVRCIL